MSESENSFEVESIPLHEAAAALRSTAPFAEIDPAAALPGVERVDRIRAESGAVLVRPEEPWQSYWVLLKGEIRAERAEGDGSWTQLGCARAGEGFGEVALLSGKKATHMRVVASRDSELIRFGEQEFWSLLACCPAVREVIVTNMAQRLQAHQVEALHRQKLVALGTLAAGLMHELHNPGAAAKRSASQLRENLLLLQQISLANTTRPKTAEQLDCLRRILEHTLKGCKAPALSSLDQADAEEAMAEWLRASGVENSYALAPALVAAGIRDEELACARAAFDARSFSDALNWLHALVSSVSLVCAIEESIGRISDLVMAVKNFSYDDRSAGRTVDVHESLQNTLTMLGHKLRSKNVRVEKRFAAAPATVFVRGAALSQVWTNLIDNAVDASPADAQIEIATWNEPGMLAASIEDRGAGIPADVLPHIFEAFFTTKPQGAGTGLGLEIVHRIVTQKLGGTIEVQSQPGRTRFLVHLPLSLPQANS
jgi:signal transduction histidine kinase